jgi:hypothetical protein
MLSSTINLRASSSVSSPSLTHSGLIYIPNSNKALYLMFPPSIMPVLSTMIGLNSNILGNSLIELHSFLNLSSLIKRGLSGLSRISITYILPLPSTSPIVMYIGLN